MPEPKRIFLSYSHKDDSYREELETHLAGLRRLKLIEMWTDRAIDGGEDWNQTISDKLESADIILFLVSAAFINSDYIWGVELKRAMERHEEGTARVVPIIVRPCEWKDAPFAKLQALPRDAKPITKWSDRDEAWMLVAQGIRRVVELPPARPAASAASPSKTASAASAAGAASAAAASPRESSKPDLPLADALLREVFSAALSAGLADSRSALLAGIDRSIVASLPVAPNAAAQIRTDLDELNRAELENGARPVRSWLHNAALLARSRVEAAVFQRALAALDPSGS